MRQRHWTTSGERLSAAMRHPRLAMAFDFDGTLAFLAPRPEGVEIHPHIRSVLEGWVSDRSIQMATVTGRALSDIRSRMPIRGMRLAGNHGLELDDGRLMLEPPPAYRDQIELAREILPRALARFPGVWIEDKTWTLTIHLRPVPPETWPAVIETVSGFAESQPLLGTRSGKAVVEIRPRGGATKADAVAELLRQWEIPPESLWFFGDDETDEDVFRRFPQGTMIRVQPSETSAAPYFLHDPLDLARLLGWIRDVRTTGLTS